MAAAFADALASKMGFAEALRPATAAGAATAAAEGWSVASRAVVDAWLPQVELTDPGEVTAT